MSSALCEVAMAAVAFVDGPLRGRDLQLDPTRLGWTYLHVEPARVEDMLSGGSSLEDRTHRYSLARAHPIPDGPVRVFAYLDHGARIENLNAVTAERWRFQNGQAV